MGEQTVPFMCQVADVIINGSLAVTQRPITVIIQRKTAAGTCIRHNHNGKDRTARRSPFICSHYCFHSRKIGNQPGCPLYIFCGNRFPDFQKSNLPADRAFMEFRFIFNPNVFQPAQPINFKFQDMGRFPFHVLTRHTGTDAARRGLSGAHVDTRYRLPHRSISRQHSRHLQHTGTKCSHHNLHIQGL